MTEISNLKIKKKRKEKKNNEEMTPKGTLARKKIKMETLEYFSTHFSRLWSMHTGHSVLFISAW